MKDTPTGTAARTATTTACRIIRRALIPLVARRAVLRRMREEACGDRDRLDGEIEGLDAGITAFGHVTETLARRS